ncbi:MAG: hypothetical protein MI923_18570 [Phycisphaerales bacterium]|nr:hypothetical protein [Phycisphaerales bacterium]
MILATISGFDAAAACIILAGIGCQFIARKLPAGLGTSLFVFGTSIGLGLVVFHHRWPVTTDIYRVCLLAALLSAFWSFLGWRSSKKSAPQFDWHSRDPAATFFAWSLVSGTIAAAIIVYVLVLATGFRFTAQDSQTSATLTSEGVVTLGSLIAAIALFWINSRDRTDRNRQQPTVMLVLIVLLIWWTSLMLPGASVSGQISKLRRLPFQPSWWTWTFQFQTSLALLLAAAAVLQDWRYRSRRKRAWPDRLDDLLQPYAQWPGYIQTEAVIASIVLILGVYQVMQAGQHRWQPQIANMLTSLTAGITCLYMTYRRWSANTAGLGMALTTLAIVALACAFAALFQPANESIEYASRLPVRLNAILLALWVMISIWFWLTRFWDQQLLDGTAWTTTGKMIPYAQRTGFLLTAIAVLVAFQMALWPARAMSTIEDNNTARLVLGSVAILLLLLMSVRNARRIDSTPLAGLAVAFLIAEIAFLFVRVPHSSSRGWLIQYNPAVLSIVALPTLALAESLQKTTWRPFAAPLWFLALLILPAWALLQLLPPARPPAEWVRPTTFAILGLVYVMAGLREHRRALLVLGAVLLLATLTDLYRF